VQPETDEANKEIEKYQGGRESGKRVEREKERGKGLGEDEGVKDYTHLQLGKYPKYQTRLPWAIMVRYIGSPGSHHLDFTEWCRAQGVDINGVAATKCSDEGIGITAARDLQVRPRPRPFRLSNRDPIVRRLTSLLLLDGRIHRHCADLCSAHCPNHPALLQGKVPTYHLRPDVGCSLSVL
jgi:hypothetical protein